MTTNQDFTLQQPMGDVQEPRATLAMHPQKFALWLFIVTVVMLFAAYTSAYIVAEGDRGALVNFTFPDIFGYNTLIIVLSSVTMAWAYVAAKRDNLIQNRIGLTATLILGIVFLAGQLEGWSAMVDGGVYFVSTSNTDSPLGSLIYVITGLHGVHLVSALIYLLVMVVKSFRYKVHSKNMLNMEMSSTYWHFLGGLWVYLYLFLLFNN